MTCPTTGVGGSPPTTKHTARVGMLDQFPRHSSRPGSTLWTSRVHAREASAECSWLPTRCARTWESAEVDEPPYWGSFVAGSFGPVFIKLIALRLKYIYHNFYYWIVLCCFQPNYQHIQHHYIQHQQILHQRIRHVPPGEWYKWIIIIFNYYIIMINTSHSVCSYSDVATEGGGWVRTPIMSRPLPRLAQIHWKFFYMRDPIYGI